MLFETILIAPILIWNQSEIPHAQQSIPKSRENFLTTLVPLYWCKLTLSINYVTQDLIFYTSMQPEEENLLRDVYYAKIRFFDWHTVSYVRYDHKTWSNEKLRKTDRVAVRILAYHKYNVI